MPRVVHFEIHATDADKVIAFYQDLFAWRFTPYGPPGTYWLIETDEEKHSDGTPSSAPGINGGLVPRRGAPAIEGQPVNAYVCTVNVDAAATYLERAVELGGSVALPLMPIPTVGWLCYAKDPDGNIFGMMQNDPSAR